MFLTVRENSLTTEKYCNNNYYQDTNIALVISDPNITIELFTQLHVFADMELFP